MTDSKIREYGTWILNYDWSEVFSPNEVAKKCTAFYDTIHQSMDTYFPTRTSKMHPTDKLWIPHYIKSLIKKRQKAFRDNKQCL